MSDAAGEQLRAAREQKGLSVDDVATRLKVPARYVVAMEKGDLGALPEATFVRGYMKAYAKAVGLESDALLAQLAPVEVKAPKQLVGLDNTGAVSTRRAPRTPKFRSGLKKHHYIAGGVLAIIAATWAVWPGSNDVPPADGAVVTTTAPADVTAPVAQSGQGPVTLDVPLPGAPSMQPAAPAPAPAVPAAGAPVAPPQPAASPATPTAAAVPVAPSAAAAPAVSAPREGLYLKFRGTSWVEVRDVDNVVIHTSIAMPQTDLSVNGKPPLTVTLGDSAAAELFFNGERVPLDKFARSGVARIIVGQAPR